MKSSSQNLNIPLGNGHLSQTEKMRWLRKTATPEKAKGINHFLGALSLNKKKKNRKVLRINPRGLKRRR
jgi:hypothetical protein